MEEIIQQVEGSLVSQNRVLGILSHKQGLRSPVPSEEKPKQKLSNLCPSMHMKPQG